MQSNDDLANLVSDFKERFESSFTIEKLRELEEKRNRINLIILKDKHAKLTSHYWHWNECSTIYLQALQQHLLVNERYSQMVASYEALANFVDNI